MGGARNLKLGGGNEGKAREQRGNIFCVWAKCWGPGTEPLVKGSGAKPPLPEVKTLSFWTCNGSRKFNCFI